VSKLLFGAAVALGAVASTAEAATLLFNVTDAAGLTVETFTLDEDEGIEDSIPGYLFFTLQSSSRGNDSAFFGSPGTFNNFGTGFKRSGEDSVAPRYDDKSDAMLFSGTGLRLSVGTGRTFSTSFGNRVSISLVSSVPEPATWAMMLIGFGAVGYTMRIRRVGFKTLEAV
jgi:hypothetical protein